MTERLYYTDSFLDSFEAKVLSATARDGGTEVVLDRSAFYPTSGGQNFDTGWISLANSKLRVKEVSENESTGEVLHLVEGGVGPIAAGAMVEGIIDRERRRDHMQQHTGQHVLSAAFEKLYQFPTVSFHMGDETCTIDLATEGLNAKQVEAAERLANEVVAEDRPVEIRFATPEEARGMGVRKIPAAEREKLRLIDIREFDLNACGGTHVRSTGQIGAILLRKTEKVRQGMRVEFVCGLRAVNIARKDFQTLTETGSVFSAHIWDAPQQARKLLDDIKTAQKAQQKLLEEVAELQAAPLLAAGRTVGDHKVVAQFFADRDLGFIKLLAQKITRTGSAVALLGCGGAQAALVFAQTQGLPYDMGSLMKITVQKLGTRGGGNKDMAQGGAPDAASAQKAVAEASLSQ